MGRTSLWYTVREYKFDMDLSNNMWTTFLPHIYSSREFQCRFECGGGAKSLLRMFMNNCRQIKFFIICMQHIKLNDMPANCRLYNNIIVTWRICLLLRRLTITLKQFMFYIIRQTGIAILNPWPYPSPSAVRDSILYTKSYSNLNWLYIHTPIKTILYVNCHAVYLTRSSAAPTINRSLHYCLIHVTHLRMRTSCVACLLTYLLTFSMGVNIQQTSSWRRCRSGNQSDVEGQIWMDRGCSCWTHGCSHPIVMVI